MMWSVAGVISGGGAEDDFFETRACCVAAGLAGVTGLSAGRGEGEEQRDRKEQKMASQPHDRRLS